VQGSCAQECLYDQLDVTEFYKGYVPSVLEAFLASEDIEAREAQLPGYIPYLGGQPILALEAYGGLPPRDPRDDAR
jgi:hypothetical protein